MNSQEQRKKDNVDLLQNYAVETLEHGNEEAIRDLNADIIVLITEDSEFKRRLENALYNNQQKLTNKEFRLEERPARPTVGNWLKHFIKEEGTEKFNSVTLSQFLTESPNAKKLDEHEKSLVRKLFGLYGNLKFFPDSMKGSNKDDWEIFPLEEQDGEQKGKDQQPPQSLSNVEQKVSGSQKNNDRSTKTTSRLEQLRKYRDQYPEGSLERKAVEGEIEELENGN